MKKETPEQLFFCELSNFFKKPIFTEHLRTAASEYRNNMSRAFKIKYEKNESDDILITYFYNLMASTYTWPNYNTSIHLSEFKNKAKLYQCIFKSLSGDHNFLYLTRSLIKRIQNLRFGWVKQLGVMHEVSHSQKIYK